MATLPAELGWVTEFRLTEPARACERPAGAYGNCLAVSVRCAIWLRGQGIECGLLHMVGRAERFNQGSGRWPLSDPAATRHWTVRVGDWSVDWTARQFRPRAAWPQVDRVERLAASWRLVEDWACPRCPVLVTDARHMELTPAGLGRRHRALARVSDGIGPYPDPRHDDSPPLALICACAPAVAA